MATKHEIRAGIKRTATTTKIYRVTDRPTKRYNDELDGKVTVKPLITKNYVSKAGSIVKQMRRSTTKVTYPKKPVYADGYVPKPRAKKGEGVARVPNPRVSYEKLYDMYNDEDPLFPRAFANRYAPVGITELVGDPSIGINNAENLLQTYRKQTKSKSKKKQ